MFRSRCTFIGLNASLASSSDLAPHRPTSPPGAPVPRLQRHPARRPQGVINQPRRKPNRHPINATTHQPDRQYGSRMRHLAVPRPLARTRTQTRRMPLSGPTPRGQTRQATGSRRGSRIPRAGHRQHGPPPRREAAARKHWQATWEASQSRYPSQMPKPVRRRQEKATQPRHPHRPPSHNVRSPWWTRELGPRRMRRDACSRKKHRCQQWT